MTLDKTSLTSKDSEASASETLMSSHAMKMGLYTINLGTKLGQKLHTAHMLILPLIPVFILLAQNTAAFLQLLPTPSAGQHAEDPSRGAAHLVGLCGPSWQRRAGGRKPSCLCRGSRGRRHALRCHRRPSCLPQHGAPQTQPSRHLQPTETGACSTSTGTRLHAETSRRGETYLAPRRASERDILP